MKKQVISILAIILGILILIFPMIGVIGAEAIIGVAILLISVFLLVNGISEIDYSPTKSILTILTGVIILIVSLIILFNPNLFAFLAAITIYLAGIILIIVGLITLIGNRDNKLGFWSGVIAVILGVIYIILGTYAENPMALGALIGIWLVLTGILRLID